MASPSPRRVAQFGYFELDLVEGELRKNGVKQKLPGQAAHVLTVLLERAGETVTRQELQFRLWSSETFVDFDHGLNNAIQKLREVLDDSPTNPRFIATIPRRGYRFLASVKVFNPSANGNKPADATIDSFSTSLCEMRQQLLLAPPPNELIALLYRLEGLIVQNHEHPRLHEARVLIDKVQSSIEAELHKPQIFGPIYRHVFSSAQYQVSSRTAAEVFDDPHALSVHDFLGQWRTVGLVRDQALVVSHTMHEENGKDVLRILAARKAKPSEKKVYAQKKKQASQR